MFNRVVLVGIVERIVSFKEPADNQTARLQFRLTVGKNLFTIIAWKNVAIAMKNNIKQGDTIMVSGTLCQWDSKVYIKVLRFELSADTNEQENITEDKSLYEI